MRSALFSLLCIFLCAANVGLAEEKPLWEAGGGFAVLDFPHYRGSDERHTQVLPVPYFVYRGEFLRVERSRVRGRIFESEQLELNVSLSGSIPVDSDDNDARVGMPDLDPSIEIGPALEIHLAEDQQRKYTLDLRLPVRAVITSELDHIGWIAHPNLNLDVRNPFDMEAWRLGMLFGPVWGSSEYHDYFYGVDPQFATPTRPAYQADSGYAGAALIAALSKRFPKFWVGGFVKFDTLDGATFDDSPLVRDKSHTTAGFAITWVFKESETMVDTGSDRESAL